MRQITVLARLLREEEPTEFKIKPEECSVRAEINDQRISAEFVASFNAFPIDPGLVTCAVVKVGRWWLKTTEIGWTLGDDGAKVRFDVESLNTGPMNKRQARQWLCGPRQESRCK